MNRLLATLSLILALLLPGTAFAAPAFDSAVNSAGASFTFTNTAGNFMDLVCVSNSATNMSATYNLVSMTLQANVQMSAQANWIQVFTLMSPATGANTVAVVGVNKVFNCSASSYSGVSTSGQPEVVTTSTTDGTSITHSITTTTNNAWVVAFFGANAQPTSYTNATSRASNTFPYLADTNGPVTPAGALSQTADVSPSGSTPWAMVQISIAPPAAAATSVSILGLVRALFIW